MPPLPEFLAPVPVDIVGAAVGGGPSASSQTGFTVEEQEQDNWCWTAVGLSIARFYNPTHAETQCQLANKSLQRADCCADGASDLDKCNIPFTLQTPLTINGNLVEMLDETLSFAEIQGQIQAKSPVGCRIGWFGGGGHFIVISGWFVGETGDKYLDIADPLDGPGPPQQIMFEEFASSYRTGGDWTHTYLTGQAAAGGAVLSSVAANAEELGA